MDAAHMTGATIPQSKADVGILLRSPDFCSDLLADHNAYANMSDTPLENITAPTIAQNVVNSINASFGFDCSQSYHMMPRTEG